MLDQDAVAGDTHDILVAFSEDESGFFDGAGPRSILQQAVADWAFFLEDLELDAVPAGAESTYIWNYPEAFSIPGNGHFIDNAADYTGFLIYAYGIDTPQLRSGGEPSTCPPKLSPYCRMNSISVGQS